MDVYSSIKYLSCVDFSSLPRVGEKNLATEEYVNSQIEAATGTDLSGYVTCSFLAGSLSVYETAATAQGKYATKSDISSVYKFIGSVDNYSDLPTSDVVAGSVYNIVNACTTKGVDAGDNVAWTGSDWDVLAGIVDLSSYATSKSLACVYTELSESITENNTNSITCSKAYTDKCIEDLNMPQYATKTYVSDEIKAVEVPGIVNVINNTVISADEGKEFDLSDSLANYSKVPLIQVFDKSGNLISIDVNYDKTSKKVKITSRVEIPVGEITIVVFAY